MHQNEFMMDIPLISSELIQYAELVYPEVEVISRENSDLIQKTTYGEIAQRSRAVAECLLTMGLSVGDVVGGFAWSTRRYLELFYSVPGMGAMLHTINPRLHSEDLAYIINDARNKALCIDRYTWEAAAAICDRLPTIEYYIWLDDDDAMPAEHPFPKLESYDQMANRGNKAFLWPTLEEHSGCTICYTSGTTGKPKGVVYTHRGNVLMTLSSVSKGFYGYPGAEGENQSFLSLTGMFHANAWMMPFASPLIGATLVLVGRDYSADKLLELIDVGNVSLAAGVPTILQTMLNYVQENNLNFGPLKKVVLAGSKPAKALVETLENTYSIQVGQAWGMTEAQMGSMPVLKSQYGSLEKSERINKKFRGGLINFGIKMRLVDDDGNDLPFDGITSGHFLVRGPWVITKYLNHAESDTSAYMTEDGWLRTGDIAVIHPDGYLEIVDRSKDLIKSGGEWIGPAIIESMMNSHPAILESAVIAIPHPKWDERPLLIAVKKAGVEVEDSDLKSFLKEHLASWWVPENIEYTDQLPRTGTGKINKQTLKETYLPKYSQA